MRTTIGACLKRNIYAFVYAEEGVGKTNLITTLADPKTKRGFAIITPEPSGPTSIVSRGYPSDIPVEVVDDIESATRAARSFVGDKTVSAVCVDGLTGLCVKAVMKYSGDEGQKALGYDGWGQVYRDFILLERECERLKNAGKSVIYTAWEKPPVYEDTEGGPSIKSRGRPMIDGQGKIWMPGNCDIIARMTSTTKRVPVNGKMVSKWEGHLWCHGTDEWVAKTRWNLPNPCPADLGWILDQVMAGKVTEVKTK